MKIGIIGNGFVGGACRYGFADCGPHECLVYDKFKPVHDIERVKAECEIVFLCTPTPFDESELRIDLSACEEAVREFDSPDRIIVVKSTVIPGTTDRWDIKYQSRFAFNPEFLTEKNHLLDFVNPDRIIIGCRHEPVRKLLLMLYSECPWVKNVPIQYMFPAEAECVKYQSNITLAAHVSVANVVYDLCKKLGADYTLVAAGVAADPRIGGSHVRVTPERGFGGKCFPKDLGAFIGACREKGVDCRPLEEIWQHNLRIRHDRNWQAIPGATTTCGYKP